MEKRIVRHLPEKDFVEDTQASIRSFKWAQTFPSAVVKDWAGCITFTMTSTRLMVYLGIWLKDVEGVMLKIVVQVWGSLSLATSQVQLELEVRLGELCLRPFRSRISSNLAGLGPAVSKIPLTPDDLGLIEAFTCLKCGEQYPIKLLCVLTDSCY
jgi:hypothetical protein